MSERTIDRLQLAGLLSPSLGDAKAETTVRDAMRAMSVPLHRKLTVDEALAVLEHVAQTPGIVGVTARFAKSRVYLMNG